MSDIKEQRIFIKLCASLGNTGAQTYYLLKQKYGDFALSRSKTFDWFNRFKAGRISIEDNIRTGRPVILRDKGIINRIREKVLSEPDISLRMLAQHVKISTGACHKILTEKLGFRKKAARKVAGEGLSSTKYIWQPLEASNNAAIKLEENDITLENLAERQQEALYDPLSENHDELGQSTQESLCKAEALSTDEESPENASRIRLIETFSDTQLNNVFTTATPHTRLNPVEIHSASGSSDISKDPTQQSLRIRPINLLKQNNLSRKSAQQNKIPSEVQRTINEKLSAKKIRLVETFSGPSSGTSRESAQQMLRLVPVESVSLNESTLNRTPIEQNPWDPLAFNIIGNRIASIQFLFRKLQEVFTHCQKKGCNPKSVQIISEESDGLNSEILIRCANCATDFEIPLTDPLSLKSCDLNMSILTKDIVSKLGHSGVNAMLENIELPQISSEKYSEVLQSISEREENVVYIKQEVEVKEEPVDY